MERIKYTVCRGGGASSLLCYIYTLLHRLLGRENVLSARVNKGPVCVIEINGVFKCIIGKCRLPVTVEKKAY